MAALKGGYPMVDVAGQNLPDELCVLRSISPFRRDHIALYALFSITVCRHALMAGFRST